MVTYVQDDVNVRVDNDGGETIVWMINLRRLRPELVHKFHYGPNVVPFGVYDVDDFI